MELNDIGQIIYDVFEARLQSPPQLFVSTWGYFKFHVGWSDKIRQFAEMSQQRAYSIDFVYTYVEGNGKEFDYGVDMTECAIQKFYRYQGAEELVPLFMCVGLRLEQAV